jgi:hypothetical protein
MRNLPYQELKRRAILLSEGDDPSSRTARVDVKTFKVDFFYTDVDGDKAMITSDSDVPSADQFDNQGVVKIFASVENMVQQSARSARSITKSSVFIIKLALAGSGGKQVDRSAFLKRVGRRIVSLPRNSHDTLLA